MSKDAANRALREAKYNARLKATKTPAELRKIAAGEALKADEEAALCGHVNMSGRSCTREQGHAAKSHRYGAR